MERPVYKTKLLSPAPREKMISVKQYATLRGISTQAVYDAIKNGHALPMVKKIQKIDTMTVLTIEESPFPAK